MPLPLPPRSSKHETKKSQSSKTLPSDHGQSEKRGENYQAKISPSSTQGPLKKRSAFEDLTNASQSQTVQPKKEANKEFVKDISKKISRNTPALGFAKNNEMNIKRCKLEPSPVVVSATLMLNMEKPLILEIPTISKTPTNEEASLSKAPLFLKKEHTTEHTTLIKRSLSLKKCTNQGEVNFLEPLTLLEETDSSDKSVVEPITFGKKHKTEDVAITKRTLFLKKMCTYQGELDISAEEHSFFMDLMNFRKKPKIEEAPLTKELLSPKQKCTIQREMSLMNKPLVLQKTTSEKKSLIKEPLSFKDRPNTAEFLFQEASTLQKKQITEKEMSILKKSLALQEKIDIEEDSLFKDPLAFKKKPTTEEANLTMKPLSLRKCTTQGKMAHSKKPLVLQKITSGETQLSFEKKPKEESLFQEPSALQEKLTIDREVAPLRKPWALQENKDNEDEFLTEPISLRMKHTTKEIVLNKKPLPLMKECTIQGKMYHLTKPIVLQKTISGKKSLIKEPLSFTKSTTEESLFHEPSALQKKHTFQEEVTTLNKPLALQKTPNEEESLFEEPLTFKKKLTIGEASSTEQMLPSKKKKYTTQDKVSCLKKPLALKTISEERSLIKKPLTFKKKPTTEEESLFKESSAVQEKHITQGEVGLLKKPRALQENIESEDKFLMEQDVIHQRVSTKELLLKKKRCAQMTKSTPQELLDLQNILNKSKYPFFMELLSLKKGSSTEKVVLTKTPFSLKKKQITQEKLFPSKKPLALEKTTSEEESLFKKLLPCNKKPATAEEFLFQDPSVLKKKHTILQQVPLLKKPLALQEKITTEEESHIKEPLTLKEKPTTEEEFLLQKPFSLHVKPINKDESLFCKSLALQRIDTKKDSLKKLLPLQDKSTTEEDFLFKKPLVLKKELSAEVATNIERQLSLKKRPTAQVELFLLKKQLALQENIINEEESLIKQPLPLKEKPSIEKETILRETLVLQGEPSIEKETFFKEFLTSQEKATIEDETILKESLALQEKTSSEKEVLFEEPLSFQEMLTINEALHFKEIIALNEKPTSGNEMSFGKSLALQEDATYKDTLLKDFFITQVETSARMSSSAPESGTGMSIAATMSSVGVFSTTSKSSACEFSSNKSFSSQGKRSQKEMTPLEDIDKDHSDPVFNSIYAKDIFSYMKEREVCRWQDGGTLFLVLILFSFNPSNEKFILKKYMNRQIDISSDMRAILVDWMVEVQMSFEMSHETLYLAVKLVDHYLMEVICKKDELQLTGSTALLIAAKFEETSPPCVDDFLYICDGIYQRDEMLAMEISILQTLKFDINIPIAYHFLRRYARCMCTSMKTLTLSRFICEMTLQEYDYIQERASKLAAGSFLLALYMKKLKHLAPTLEYYSGYKISDLHPLVKQLNILLTLRHHCCTLKTVLSKYSNQIFFEVTKIPPLDVLKLEKI